METTTERAGFGVRLGAYLIDAVVFFVLSILLAPILGGIVGGVAASAAAGSASDVDAASAAAAGGILGMILGALIAIPFIYFIYYLVEGLTGYTLGKLALGLRVGADNATKATTGALMTRYAVKVSGNVLSILGLLTGVGILGTIGSLVGLVLLVGCFMVLGAKRQSIHDMISKTAVYKKGQVS